MDRPFHHQHQNHSNKTFKLFTQVEEVLRLVNRMMMSNIRGNVHLWYRFQ